MNTYRTHIYLKPSEEKISYESPVMLLGSCFTENIGRKMEELKMPVDINPFGNIYNPLSIKNSIDILLQKKIFSEQDLFLSNELWSSFYHHSNFSDIVLENCLATINKRIEASHIFLKKAEYLILTFGTSWVYQHKKTGNIVSNCHKLLPSEFERKKLDVDEIVDVYKDIIKNLISFKPNLKIIFTLSPIRHWKDGAVDNMHSKATLLVAIHKLCEQFSTAHYFPAYEIMMDDLRDYRFYEEDMLHPSSLAIKYIWDKFSEVFFEKNTVLLQKEIDEIVRAMRHRPVNPELNSHKIFRQAMLQKISEMEKKHPFLNLQQEKSFFSDSV